MQPKHWVVLTEGDDGLGEPRVRSYFLIMTCINMNEKRFYSSFKELLKR